ncbi:MAG: FAD-dependent oxidoreductase [Edaphobacter sp.]|uniref:NAD(P)/FAD-dependent oxidoreductase n=1 Tax=Edaphobacter sp. TaxID=1934404 RepID=UPI0023A46BDA|nr:FAD-dependent oxidoreductase [Edaphobacter sp.]MDE1177778.1 FAD-dependent oxidoreductase [Edaphobacter sp.]
MSHPDVCIAGAGIIGLSLALELHQRGARVAVYDQGDPLAEASTAAAGMLAAYDPENPLALLELSKLSISRYPAFLNKLFELSRSVVSLHTSTTLQGLGAGRKPLPGIPTISEQTIRLLVPELRSSSQPFILLDENSLNPRELAVSLLTAVRATSISLHTQTPIRLARSSSRGVEIHTDDESLTASRFVDCTGAWGFTPTIPAHLRPRPRKGQMLAVAASPSQPLHVVIRTPEIYIVPRTADPARTRWIVGATVEDAGFDKKVHPEDIARLRQLAADLLPAVAEAPELETWAGLRPSTVDRLPLLGEVSPNHFIAAGHYRNGIMLAPGTAYVMSQLLAGKAPSVELSPFHPFRAGVLPEA